MKTSEQIDLLATALAAAQWTMKHADKDGKSHHGGFSTLAEIMDTIREPFGCNGLSYIQVPSIQDGRVHMMTRIMHKSGQWIEGEFNVKPIKDDIHASGSAVTYLRRYMLAPMTGCASKDDDGNAAMGKDLNTGKFIVDPHNVVTEPPFDIRNEEDRNGVLTRLKAINKNITTEEVKRFMIPLNGQPFEEVQRSLREYKDDLAVLEKGK